jgi:SH3 domain protein
MKRTQWYVFLIVICSFYLHGNGLAETLYITDRLYLSLRDAPEVEQPSVAVLRSDTKVELLETQDDWAKVELEDGRTGWVMKKYLVRDLPRSLILDQLREEVKNKSLTIEDFQGQIKNMSLRIEELEGQLNNKSRIIGELEGQIKNKSLVIEKSGGQAKNIPLILERLREENASLKKEIGDVAALKAREAAMKREIEDLKNKAVHQNKSPEMATEKDSLAERKGIYVVGTGALLLGVIIGYLVRRPDKNRYYLK